MANTTLTDLPGSTYTAGVNSSLYDRALRVCLAQGANLTSETQILSIEEAVQRVFDTIGIAHHINTTLPCAYLTARRWGAEKVWVHAHYFRRSTTFPPQPGVLYATFQTAFRSTAWYRRPYTLTGSPAYTTDGKPNGVIEYVNQGNPEAGLTDPSAIARRWQWTQAGIRILVPTNLNFNPFPLYALRVNTVNASTALFGGYTFPVRTVRFDGMFVKWVGLSNGVHRFDVNYAFTSFREGFPVQIVIWDGSQWTTVEGDEHQAASWGSGFQV